MFAKSRSCQLTSKFLVELSLFETRQPGSGRAGTLPEAASRFGVRGCTWDGPYGGHLSRRYVLRNGIGKTIGETNMGKFWVRTVPGFNVRKDGKGGEGIVPSRYCAGVRGCTLQNGATFRKFFNGGCIQRQNLAKVTAERRKFDRWGASMEARQPLVFKSSQRHNNFKMGFLYLGKKLYLCNRFSSKVFLFVSKALLYRLKLKKDAYY